MDLPVLQSDCASCFGLCCVLLPFSRESGFGVTKAGGTPCHNLDAHDGCSIHTTLREDGWPGCTAFECLGAGQQVSRVTYGAVSWREHDNLGEMAATFSVMRVLHEMLTHLGEAARRGTDTAHWLEHVGGLTAATPETLLTLDLDDLYERVGQVLTTASTSVRAAWPDGADLGRADLAGRDLSDRDLRGADLRGAVLIAADLRALDITDADLLGADLRDADVRGADLSGALFLTQPQVNVLRGNAATLLPERLNRPGHWS